MNNQVAEMLYTPEMEEMYNQNVARYTFEHFVEMFGPEGPNIKQALDVACGYLPHSHEWYEYYEQLATPTFGELLLYEWAK